MKDRDNIERLPLVSVPVITYNSALTVLETLESIKAQTYPNIELIVSDDCSTDNTVALCREWIAKNKERFTRVEIVTVPQNTGVSANCNRADAVCKGDWIKSIAGDDVLLPNCIADCVTYVAKHPNIIVLFGRLEVFGGSDAENRLWESKLNYDLFSLPIEKLLYHLQFVDNGIPAPSMFYSRRLFEEYNIHDDERIPLLNDWPKWINISKAGIKMYLLNKVIVRYRLAGMSTGVRSSLHYYESERLFRLLYLYPVWKSADADYAIKRMVKEECDIYKQLVDAESEEASNIHQQRDKYRNLYQKYYQQYTQIYNSWAYRIGKTIMRPLSVLKSVIKTGNGK